MRYRREWRNRNKIKTFTWSMSAEADVQGNSVMNKDNHTYITLPV